MEKTLEYENLCFCKKASNIDMRELVCYKGND